MDKLYILAATAAVIWYLRNTVFWVYLWQKKEYRLDRLLIHLFETAQGKGILFAPLSLLKWVGVIFYVETVFNETTITPFHLLVVAIFVIEALRVMQEVVTGQLKRPELTKKALSLILLSICTILLIIFIPLVDKFFWLLLIDKLLFFIVAFYVFLHSFPTELYRDILVTRAIRKIRGYNDLTVIGIAGSYGKSSTKEWIAQVLGSKFAVVKTKRNQHTLAGIADVILKDVSQKTEVFVVEMGAYGGGEIRALCYVVRPTIGIITGINDQHMSLFRSTEGNISSKRELINALPKNGRGLFNTSDAIVKKMYAETTVHKVAYGASGITASDIKVDKTSVSFTVHFKKKSYALKTPLLGGHNIINLLPAIYLADYFGMTQAEIQQGISHLTPLPHTMVRKISKGGITVIDDTFNSNPESIAAMVAYMKLYKKKRFFVLQPMIELGRNAKEHHFKIGTSLATSCDVLFLTNKNYARQIRKGIKDRNGTCRVIVGGANACIQQLKKEAKRGDIILCEGREAKAVVDKLGLAVR